MRDHFKKRTEFLKLKKQMKTYQTEKKQNLNQNQNFAIHSKWIRSANATCECSTSTIANWRLATAPTGSATSCGKLSRT